MFEKYPTKQYYRSVQMPPNKYDSSYLTYHSSRLNMCEKPRYDLFVELSQDHSARIGRAGNYIWLAAGGLCGLIGAADNFGGTVCSVITLIPILLTVTASDAIDIQTYSRLTSVNLNDHCGYKYRYNTYSLSNCDSENIEPEKEMNCNLAVSSRGIIYEKKRDLTFSDYSMLGVKLKYVLEILYRDNSEVRSGELNTLFGRYQLKCSNNYNNMELGERLNTVTKIIYKKDSRGFIDSITFSEGELSLEGLNIPSLPIIGKDSSSESLLVKVAYEILC